MEYHSRKGESFQMSKRKNTSHNKGSQQKNTEHEGQWLFTGLKHLSAFIRFSILDPLKTLPGMMLVGWIIALILIPPQDRANFAIEAIQTVFSPTWYPIFLTILLCAIIAQWICWGYSNKLYEQRIGNLEKELKKLRTKP